MARTKKEYIDQNDNKMSVSDVDIRLKIKNDSKHGYKSVVILRFNSLKDGRRVFYKSFHPEKHTFKKNNSVGLCYEAMRLMKDNDIIALRHQFTGGTVYASVSEARKAGTFMHFKTQGFEKQFFIPLECFKETLPEDKGKAEGTPRPVEIRSLSEIW